MLFVNWKHNAKRKADISNCCTTITGHSEDAAQRVIVREHERSLHKRARCKENSISE